MQLSPASVDTYHSGTAIYELKIRSSSHYLNSFVYCCPYFTHWFNILPADGKYSQQYYKNKIKLRIKSGWRLRMADC